MSESNESLENRLSGILSDPGAMSSIMNIINNIKASPGSHDAVSAITPAQSTVHNEIHNNQFPTNQSHGFDSKSIGLLYAIKPFLNDERAKKLDVITQIIKVISLGDLLR